MCEGENGEFPPLVAQDVHHQEDQHGDDILATVEPAVHQVGESPYGPAGLEADVCGEHLLTLGPRYRKLR